MLDGKSSESFKIVPTFVILAIERAENLQQIETVNPNVSDEILQNLKIQIDLDQKNVSELENQSSEFAAILESINLDLKVRFFLFIGIKIRILGKQWKIVNDASWTWAAGNKN